MTIQKKLYNYNDEITINVTLQKEIIPTEAINSSNIPISNISDQLFENIKTICKQEEFIIPKTIYFTSAKGIFEFQLDNSIFMPSRAILLQPRKLEKLYLKELESIIYNTKEQFSIDKLLPLIILFSYINKKNYPIKIVSSSYKKLLPRICNTLNEFLNKDYIVIRSIYESFNSIKDSDEEQMVKK